ncbi:MAG TPA: hypothetical protein VGH57_33340 [Amycolatopsis sp.]
MRLVRLLPPLAAAVVVSGLLAVSGLLSPPGRTSAAADAGCDILQVENQFSGSSSVVRLTVPEGDRRELGETGYALNAIAYSADQDMVYGVADAPRHGRFSDGAHAVEISRSGQVTDLGAVGRAGRRGGWSWATGATAGAIDGTTWYLQRANDLYTVDIDPAGPDYLTVTGRVQLRPVVLASGVDDFAYDAASGLLYGVSMSFAGHGRVVTIDPRTGHVEPVPGLRFPAASAYGAVVLGPDKTLYATANRIGYRSVTYRLPLDGSSPAAEISTGPPLVSSDAAGCLVSSPPPSSPPPSSPPPPSSSPSPPPSSSSSPPPPSSSPTPAPPPLPPLPPPPNAPVLVEQPSPQPRTDTPTPSPTPTPTPSAVQAPPPSPTPSGRPKPQPSASPVVDTAAHVKEQRRWGLTVLILVLGAGAAASRVRRGR